MENGTELLMSVAPGRSRTVPYTHPDCINKVGGIRGFRMLTNSGLKEAKEFIEDVMDGKERTFTLLITDRFAEEYDVTFESAREKLLEAGFVVKCAHNKRYKQADSIRHAAITALELSDFDTAEALTSVLREHFNGVELEDL